MGTSHAVLAPNTKKWEKVVGSLRSPVRNAEVVADTVFSAALPMIPSGFVSVPIGVAAYEGLRFSYLVNKKGFDDAVKQTALRVTEKYIAPSISSSLWNIVTERADPRFMDSIYGKVAETAFKKTLNAILTKGVEAMED